MAYAVLKTIKKNHFRDFHNLNNLESRAKIWYQYNAPQWLWLLSLLKLLLIHCSMLLPLFVGVLCLVLVLVCSTQCPF